MFNRITVETHKPIPLKNADLETVFNEMETTIKEHIN
jgi:hypothetical protein